MQTSLLYYHFPSDLSAQCFVGTILCEHPKEGMKDTFVVDSSTLFSQWRYRGKSLRQVDRHSPSGLNAVFISWHLKWDMRGPLERCAGLWKVARVSGKLRGPLESCAGLWKGALVLESFGADQSLNTFPEEVKDKSGALLAASRSGPGYPQEPLAGHRLFKEGGDVENVPCKA